MAPALLVLLIQVVGLLNTLLAAPAIPAETQTRVLTIAREAIEIATRQLEALPPPVAPPVMTPAATSTLPAEFSPSVSPRSVTYSVSSHDPGPAITKIVFDPDPLKLANETQKFWIWARDPRGADRVWIVIDADSSSFTVPLALTAGTAEDGVWSGEWQGEVDAAGLAVYRTKTYAAAGESQTLINMNWTNN